MKNDSRRDWLLKLAVTGALSGAGSVRGAEAVAGSPARSGMAPRLRVVVTGGHPGDPEYGCGGTIARFTELGHEVVLLYLNRGDPNETAVRPASGIRTAEATQACALLKARPAFVGQIDGHAVLDPDHFAAFRRMLETERPDIVFTHWPIDNHADHRAMSGLVHDAWVTMRRSFALYYYEVSTGEDTLQFAPTHWVDISTTEKRKRQACYAHASQSPDRYYAMQSTVTRMRGLERGCSHAEGFVRLAVGPDVPLP